VAVSAALVAFAPQFRLTTQLRCIHCNCIAVRLSDSPEPFVYGAADYPDPIVFTVSLKVNLLEHILVGQQIVCPNDDALCVNGDNPIFPGIAMCSHLGIDIPAPPTNDQLPEKKLESPDLPGSRIPMRLEILKCPTPIGSPGPN
jgi:hypothetical protein